MRASRRGTDGDRGQSETVGVVILVGVVVLTVSTAGWFVATHYLDQARAHPTFADADVNATEDTLVVTHRGGERLPEAGVTVIVRSGAGTVRYDMASDPIDRSGDGDGTFEPGESVTFAHSLDGSLDVLLVNRRNNDVFVRATVRVPDDGVVDPANFAVRIDHTTGPVTAGETLSVRATVTNTGDRSATQDVELVVDGLGVVDTRRLTLGGGAWRQITLEWATSAGDAGTRDVTVRTDDDADTTSVTVQTPGRFDVTIDDTNSPVRAGSTAQVTATIQNTGESRDTQSIALDVAGQPNPVDTRLVALDGGDSRQLTLNWSTASGDSGTYDVAVRSEDDVANGTVSVTPPGSGAVFAVRIDRTNSPITRSETLVVNATVTNTGASAGNQTIEFEVDGVTDARQVTLLPNDSVSLSFSWATGAGDAGNYTATVRSANDSATRSVRVLEPAFFDVEIVDTNAPVEAGSPLTVTSTITNTGEATGTQTIDLDISAQQNPVNATSLTLGPGDARQVTLAWSTSVGDAGTYTATVRSDDVSDARSGLEVDQAAPVISNFSASVTSGNTIEISVDSDEQLSTIEVEVASDGTRHALLDETDFSTADTAPPYTYVGTWTAANAADFPFTVTLLRAADADGNDGASGESVTVDKGGGNPGQGGGRQPTGRVSNSRLGGSGI